MILQTGGGTVAGDGGSGAFLVVATGEGDFVINNGNELLALPRGSLAGSDLDGALVTDNGVQREIQDSITNRPVMFESTQALLLEDLTGYDRVGAYAFYTGWNADASIPVVDIEFRRAYPPATGTASTLYANKKGFFDVNGDAFEIVADYVKASQVGCYKNGTDDDLSLLIAFFENNSRCLVDTGTYLVSDRVIVASTGSDKKVRFEPGVTIVSTQPATTATGILYFQDAADGLDIDFNWAVIKYQTDPTVRTAQTVYVTGATITNCDIRNFDIQNSSNMGVAVFCGDAGTTASGSHTIRIHDGKVSNSLGDGVHIENCDHTAEIYNIKVDNSDDDAVAIINYTGAGGAATKTTPTYNAKVYNIIHRNSAASTVSLSGVEDFLVDNIATEGMTGGFTVKMTHSAGYTVGNQYGVIDNIVADGQGKVFAFDTPSGGTAYNRYITVGKVVGNEIGADILSLSNTGTSSDDKLRDITFTNLNLHGDGSGDSRAFYIANTKNVRIEKLNARNLAIASTATANDNFSWDSMVFDEFVATAANGLNISSNTNVKPGNLLVDATNCTNGLNFTSNSGVVHLGLWSVTGAGTSNYTFGSNTSVQGHFYEYMTRISIGSVTAGTSNTVSFADSVPSGVVASLSVLVESAEGLRWGVSGRTAAQFDVDWTDNMTSVFIDYNVRWRS